MKSRLLCRRHFSLQSSCLTRFVHCIVCLFLCVFEPFSAGDIFTGQLFDNAVLKFVWFSVSSRPALCKPWVVLLRAGCPQLIRLSGLCDLFALSPAWEAKAMSCLYSKVVLFTVQKFHLL